jgi:hypothetical protein
MYKGFQYQYYVDHYRVLRNYPPTLTNYDVEPFCNIYRAIEGYMSDPRGIMIASENPLNTGSLLIPIALTTEAYYISAANLVYKDADDIKPIADKPSLILDELGSEDPSTKWMVERIVNHRYSEGLKTYFGLAMKDWGALGQIYGNLRHKIISMTCYKLALPYGLIISQTGLPYMVKEEKS